MIAKYKQKKKGSWQNVFFSVLMVSLVVTVLGFLVVSNYRISKKRSVLNTRIDELQAEVKEMQDKKAQLEAQLYQSGQEEYLEREAREKLNLQKPGEEVVTVLPEATEETQQGEEKIRQWWNPLTW